LTESRPSPGTPDHGGLRTGRSGQEPPDT
jgi:hypothetical protein